MSNVYVKRKEEIEAIQWDGTDETLAAIKEMIGEFPIKIDVASKPAFGAIWLQSPRGETSVSHGDWITKDSYGTIDRYSDNVFQKIYAKK